MVEFALALPIVLLMLYGVIELGRFFQAYLTVQHAAREGARYAVTGQSITGVPDDRPASIVTKARAATAGLIVAPRSDLPDFEPDSTTEGYLDIWLDPLNGGDTRELITVTVTYNYSPLLPMEMDVLGGRITLLPRIIPMQGYAVMINERIDRVTPVAEGSLPPSSTPCTGCAQTPTPPPSATATSSAPTATSPPTSTSLPTSTATQTPTQTATSTPSPTPGCAIVASSLTLHDKKVTFSLTNNEAAAVRIEDILVDWPENPDDKLKKVKMDGTTLWDDGDTNSPTSIPAEGGWAGGPSDRTLSAGQTATLEFEFQRNVAGDHTITFTFDNGCVVQAGGSTPTATPTPTPACSIAAGNLTLNGKEISLALTNNSGGTVILTELVVEWPADDKELREVKLDGIKIWDKKDKNPDTSIPDEGNWKGGADRSIPDGDTEVLLIKFKDNVVPSRHVVTATFDNGCSITQSN